MRGILVLIQIEYKTLSVRKKEKPGEQGIIATWEDFQNLVLKIYESFMIVGCPTKWWAR